MKVYRTIVADPPWPETGAGVKGGRRGADRHYPLMSFRQIEDMGEWVRSLADPEGCHLYLWTTNRFLPQALRVMDAWGFSYRTVITWAKDRKGLGQYFRGMSEQCLFGVRGRLPYRFQPDGTRAQGVTLIQAKRHGHSEKPEALLDMAELVSHPPRLELFARRQRLGWDPWGNEAIEVTRPPESSPSGPGRASPSGGSVRFVAGNSLGGRLEPGSPPL